MKRNSPLVRAAGDNDLNTAMTPMIDVVFLLLVFFVWTASFQVVEYLLPSELSAQLGSDSTPVEEPPPPDDFEDVVIRIRWQGQQPQWTINQQPLGDVQAVGEQLQAIAAVGVDATVILHPDPVVPLGVVIETYDVAKLAGFNNVSFAVNRAAAGG